MYKFSLIFLVIMALMAGCKKAAAPARAGDSVERKLQELAGSRAKNCGRVAGNADVKGASDCAMQASAAKQPFYVGYDLPGLTVAVAGTADGKLYSVQMQPPASGQTGESTVQSIPCPAELRVAQSGRVTCMTPGSMGMGGVSPHGGVSMPPGTMESPHGGMTMPPAGAPNPHGGMGADSGKSNPHGSEDAPGKKAPAKHSSNI